MNTVMNRRALLLRGGALAAAMTVPRWALPSGAPAAVPAPFTQPLRMPEVLTGSDITIPIIESPVPILPGAETKMWTFAGQFPGPTIRRPTGTTTRVTFEHRLPKAAGPLTIHHHGHHTASIDDGQPMSELIDPGKSRTYTYVHREEGAPLRAAMRWYHDHSHERTGRNLWMGLMGLFIVEDPAEAELGLPTGDRELTLVISERSFDDNNQLTDPFTTAPDPSADGVGAGDVLLVNGVPQPYVEVLPTTYRIRILNAASFRPYNIGFAGPEFKHVGSESGLFPAPLPPGPLNRLTLGPAERADFVVDFSGMAGADVVLNSYPYTNKRVPMAYLPYAPSQQADIMQFRVRGAAAAPAAVASSLRALPKWASQLPAVPDRLFVLGRGVAADGTQKWTINGLPYDPDTVAAQPELGSTETWLLVNASQQTHYVHLHDVDWKVVSRNGSEPIAQEDVLKETFRLDPGDVVAVGTKFTDHLGKYMLHCHMTSHEDHAMMTTFEVVEPGQGDRLPLKELGISAPAVVAGRPVEVPLGALTADEATRVTEMLAGQLRAAGRPAAAPVVPLNLGRGAVALCDLRGS
jgi:spore coat protein A, manganese oxidase